MTETCHAFLYTHRNVSCSADVVIQQFAQQNPRRMDSLDLTQLAQLEPYSLCVHNTVKKLDRSCPTTPQISSMEIQPCTKFALAAVITLYYCILY